MANKRKSCPVKRRLVIELEYFNKKDKTTFTGSETVRGLNKFDKRWFRENDIAILMTGKTIRGATFVVPYINILGVRYWILDKEKREKRLLRESLYKS